MSYTGQLRRKVQQYQDQEESLLLQIKTQQSQQTQLRQSVSHLEKRLQNEVAMEEHIKELEQQLTRNVQISPRTTEQQPTQPSSVEKNITPSYTGTSAKNFPSDTETPEHSRPTTKNRHPTGQHLVSDTNPSPRWQPSDWYDTDQDSLNEQHDKDHQFSRDYRRVKNSRRPDRWGSNSSDENSRRPTNRASNNNDRNSRCWETQEK